jgi:hypothetical protein
MTQRSVALDKTRFTQDSINAVLDDGTSINDLIAELRNGDEHPTSLDIEVFKDDDGVYWALSNRRMYAVKTAFGHVSGYQVFVTVYDSSDDDKVQEWRRKLTTTTYGGLPRVRGAASAFVARTALRCSACGNRASDFSSNQLSKGDERRCPSCVENDNWGSDQDESSTSARHGSADYQRDERACRDDAPEQHVTAAQMISAMSERAATMRLSSTSRQRRETARRASGRRRSG